MYKARDTGDNLDTLWPRAQLSSRAYEALAKACEEVGAGRAAWTHVDGVRYVHVTFIPLRVRSFQDELLQRKINGHESPLDPIGRESRKNIEFIPGWARASQGADVYAKPDPRAAGRQLALPWTGHSDQPPATSTAIVARASARAGAGAGGVGQSWPPGGGARVEETVAPQEPAGFSKGNDSAWQKRQRKSLRCYRDSGTVIGDAGSCPVDDSGDGRLDIRFSGLSAAQRQVLYRICDNFKLGYVCREEGDGTRVLYITRYPEQCAKFAKETEQQKEVVPPPPERLDGDYPRLQWKENENAAAFPPRAAPDRPVVKAEDVAVWPAGNGGSHRNTQGSAFPVEYMQNPNAIARDPRGEPPLYSHPLRIEAGVSAHAPQAPLGPPQVPCSLDFWHDYKYWARDTGDETDRFVQQFLSEILVGFPAVTNNGHDKPVLYPGLLQDPALVLEVMGRLPQTVVGEAQTRMSIVPPHEFPVQNAQEEEAMSAFWEVFENGVRCGGIVPRQDSGRNAQPISRNGGHVPNVADFRR